MDDKGAKKVVVEGLGDKRQVTATFAGTLAGDFLPIQILYQGKTERVHPHYKFPEGFDIWHTHNHWASQQTTIHYLKKVIIPYIQCTRESKQLGNKPSLAIFDAFTGHSGQEINELLESNNIIVVKVPASCTDELQPMDLSINISCKSSLRQNFSMWYAERVAEQIQSGTPPKHVKINMAMQIMRELSAKWITDFFDYVNSNKYLVINGFKKAGIVDALHGDTSAGVTDKLGLEDPFASDSDS